MDNLQINFPSNCHVVGQRVLSEFGGVKVFEVFFKGDCAESLRERHLGPVHYNQVDKPDDGFVETVVQMTVGLSPEDFIG